MELQRLHLGAHRVIGLMLGQDLLDDVGDRQVLKHPRGATQAQQCKRRLDGQTVLGKAAITAIQGVRQQLLGGDLSAIQLQGEQALVLGKGGGEADEQSSEIHAAGYHVA